MTAGQAPKIGLLLPSREAVLWCDGDLSRVVDSGRQAEHAGYDSVWAGDSLLARPRGEPFTLLAAVAAVTTRVELGTAVLLPLLRHPLTLAHTAATLDRIAHGRLILGVGPGADVPGTHAELAALGVTTDRRVSAMLHGVERCRRLWRGEEPGVELLPSPQTVGGPPLWLAAQGPRLLRRAGGQFDGWLPASPTPDDYAAGWQAVRQAAEQAGRNPDAVTAGAYLTISVADKPEQASQELDTYMQAYYGLPGEVMAQIQACHAGTLETASEWIARYVASGARHLVLRLAQPTLDGYDATARELLAAAKPGTNLE